jgi:hypothetical protein
MVESKKGISVLVATILLVLLAIAFTIITWNFLESFIGNKTIQDLERNCLTNKAVENCKWWGECNGVCVTKYVDIENKTYGCQIPCGHIWKDNIKFTDEEIKNCNITALMEQG